jgi:serine/threonine protein kinase
MENHVPDCTLPYTPPECLKPKLNYEAYSHKIDVYSFGMMLIEFLFRMCPTMEIKKGWEDKMINKKDKKHNNI